MYVVVTQGNGFPDRTWILKFNSSGTLIASVSEPIQGIDGIGYELGRGIAYHNGRLYLGGGPKGDCVATLDASTLQYLPSLSLGNVPGQSPKGLRIVAEYCPTSPTTNVPPQNICGQIGDRIFLQNMLSCNGPICGGSWSINPGTTGLAFNACDNSVTVTSLPATGNISYQGTTGPCGNFSINITINVSNPSAPAVTATQPNCFVSTGSLTVTSPTGSGVQYSFDNGGTYSSSATRTGFAPGTYFVRVRQNGCDSPPTQVSIFPSGAAPAAPTVTTTSSTSCINPQGSITVTSPTGSGFLYSFDNGATYGASATRTSVSPGTYQIRVKDSGGCESTATSATVTSSVTLPAAPSITTTQPTCFVPLGSITITNPTGSSFTYSFDNGLTYGSLTTLTNVPVGTYQIRVKGTNGCESAATPAVISPNSSSPPAPTFTVTQPTCPAPTGSITITSPTGAGILYSFDNGATFGPTTTRTGLAPGTYQLRVLDNNGCESATASATINTVPNAPVAPTVTVTQPTCALLGTITVTSPTGAGFTYSFDDGATYGTSPTRTSVGPGTYRVRVRNSALCVSAFTNAVLNPAPGLPIPDISVVQLSCNFPTGAISVNNTAPNFEYSFNNGATYSQTGSLAGLAPGTYIVSVRDINTGCVSAPFSAVIVPLVVTRPAPTISATDPSCGSGFGTITILSPTTGATYEYGTGTGFVVDTTRQVLPGTYSVRYLTDDGCFSFPATATIVDRPVPVAPTLTGVQPTCDVPTGSITVTSPTGAGFRYSFDNGVTSQTSPTKSGLAPGTYSVRVISDKGCVGPPSQLTINAVPTAPAAPTLTLVQPTCALPTGSITITAPTGATFAYSFDNGLTYQTSATKSGLSPGTYQVRVRRIADNCVSLASTATIAPVPALPAAPTLTVVQPTCVLATGSITVTSPTGSSFTYSFDNGVTYQTSVTRSTLSPGVYRVRVRRVADQCVSLDTEVTINPVPTVPAAPTVTRVQPTCDLATGSITVTSPTGSSFTYSFDNGVTYQASPTRSLLNPGTYQVRVRRIADQCVSLATSAIINPQPITPTPPTIVTTQPTCAVATGTITVTSPVAGTGFSYSFNNGDTYSSVASDTLVPGTYQVRVRSVAGCESGATVSTITAPICAFDLALRKTLASGQSATVAPGSTVNFTITVFNQSSVDATNIQVSDYIPAGLTLNDANWTALSGVATLNTPIASLLAGQ
ncbi:MAG: DUF11 domain-containing protein, partial [Runella slithyformis]